MGDLHDIWFLLNRGIRLEPNDRAALHDDLAAAEVDPVEKLAQLDEDTWAKGLTQAGIKGLDREGARWIVRAVRQAAAEL